MALMKEAMTRDNWDRVEKGLPPLKAKKFIRPEPPKPDIENEVKLEDIKNFVALRRAEREIVKNLEGSRFIGYKVEIEIMVEGKRKPGRPKESEKEIPLEPMVLEGWMNEGEFLQLVRTYREKINTQIIKW